MLLSSTWKTWLHYTPLAKSNKHNDNINNQLQELWWNFWSIISMKSFIYRRLSVGIILNLHTFLNEKQTKNIDYSSCITQIFVHWNVIQLTSSKKEGAGHKTSYFSMKYDRKDMFSLTDFTGTYIGKNIGTLEYFRLHINNYADKYSKILKLFVFKLFCFHSALHTCICTHLGHIICTKILLALINIYWFTLIMLHFWSQHRSE